MNSYLIQSLPSFLILQFVKNQSTFQIKPIHPIFSYFSNRRSLIVDRCLLPFVSDGGLRRKDKKEKK